MFQDENLSYRKRFTFDAVGFGAMNMDQLMVVPALPNATAELEAEVSLTPGGSAANTIYGLAKLGLRTAFVGVIGDDQNGSRLKESLREVGVDTRFVRRKSAATSGIACVLSTPHDIRVSMLAPGANSTLSRNDIEDALEIMQQASIVHISSFVGQRQFEIQKEVISQLGAERGNAFVSFSPGELYARRSLSELKPILHYSKYIILNQAELRYLTGYEDIGRGSQILLDNNVQHVVVTMGKGVPDYKLKIDRSPKQFRVISPGASVRHSKQFTAAICHGDYCDLVPSDYRWSEEERAETNGAGDAFAAGFLWSVIRELPVEVGGLVGQAVAQACVRAAGARAGLPAHRELSRLYAALYGHELREAHEIVPTSIVRFVGHDVQARLIRLLHFLIPATTPTTIKKRDHAQQAG